MALALILSSAIVRSKFGKVLVGVRDAESRTRFLGYRVEHIKLFAFVVSAMMAGIAGALYVPQIGIINPGEFAPANSIEVVIWTAVGGRATLIGPIIGAILVNGGKTIFTGLFPDFWLFALGGLFVARDAVPAQGHRRHGGAIYRQRSQAGQPEGRRGRGRRSRQWPTIQAAE